MMNNYCLRVMDSKSLPNTNTFQRWASSEQLEGPTDPIIYAVENCRSDGSKMTSKRNSEESLERASKRSRTSQSPSESCSQTSSATSSSDSTASSSSACTGPPDSTAACHIGSGEVPSWGWVISESSNETVSGTEIKNSIKRKSTSDESEEGPRKRKRGTPSSAEDHTQSSSDSSSTEDGLTSTTAIVCKNSRKRKSEETEGPRKRGKMTPSHQDPTEASSSGTPSTFTPTNSRAAFMAKYKEEKLLGEGGFGSVFAGYRQGDNLPVAIKHISQSQIERTSMFLHGKFTMVPLEVVLLMKVKPAAPGTSAVISLLDWYDLKNELILILERPVPCLDLIDYMNSVQSTFQEDVAKTIAKQLVDALIMVHSRGVFHRDIKLDNILIETGSDVPRVRLIDFGCGTFLSEEKYTTQQGTYVYTSPEWFLDGHYTAEPTTVWQIGVVLFAMLHGYLPFNNRKEIINNKLDVSRYLSFGSQSFLHSCLAKSPEARPTLETLKHHPWLI